MPYLELIEQCGGKRAHIPYVGNERRVACPFLHSDPDLHCPITESKNTVENISEQTRGLYGSHY